MDFAEVVVNPRHFEPFRVGRNHAPRSQIVQRRAPQNGFFTARVHGDVAADARCFRRSRIDRKHITRPFRRVRHALGDDTGFRPNRGDFFRHTGKCFHFHFGDGIEFFGVNHHAFPRQRNSAAGVTRAAAARNNRQTEFDTAFHQLRHFLFGIGREDDKRVFDAPIGGIGNVRHARKAVELDVIFFR